MSWSTRLWQPSVVRRRNFGCAPPGALWSRPSCGQTPISAISVYTSVDTFEGLFEAPPCSQALGDQRQDLRKPPRSWIVTTTGGGGGRLVADRLALQWRWKLQWDDRGCTAKAIRMPASEVGEGTAQRRDHGRQQSGG